ncbi:MAG: ABC transporter permease [Myxococcales bacterium]
MDFLQDLRFALRSLVQRPGFTLVACLALGLGIGANTAIFTVVNAALLRPLPYADADRVAVVDATTRPSPTGQAVSGGDFVDLRAQARSFAGLAAFRNVGFNLIGGDAAEHVDGAIVSRDFFEVLGTRPLLGRTFTAAPGGPREAMLGESLWRRRYSAWPGIVGQTITMNGEPFVVAGVMTSAVRHPDAVQLWVTPRHVVPEHPLHPSADTSANHASQYLDVIARLRPGVDLAQAQAELSTLGARLEQLYPNDDTGRGFKLTLLREDAVGSLRPTLVVLAGAVAFILLIACANVANLMLARAVGRAHEVAIRLALGATRWRLLRLFLGESLVLAALGGGLGLLLALWIAPGLAALRPGALAPETLRLDLRVLAFTGALALATAVVFGILPALQVDAPAEALKEAGRTGTGGLRRARLRSALIVLEVALALVLLIGAGLLVRSFVRLQRVDPGFQPAGAMTADVWLPPGKYSENAQQAAFFREVVRRLSAAAGVEAAGVVSRLPLSRGNSTRSVQPAGNPEKNVDADYRLASPAYFAALRIPLRAGRAFADADLQSGARVAMVNEAFARQMWPDANPLGQRIVLTPDGKPIEVTGVIGNVRHLGLELPPRPEVYVPEGLEAWPFMTFVVRGHGQLATLLRTEVAAVDRDQALTRVETMEQRMADSLAPRRFGVLLIGALAAVAFVLAITGIYGVMAYSVAQRTREMGIRLALGATPGAVLRLVLRQGMRLVVVGVALGLAAALPLGRVLRTLLYGVTATDPGTFVALAVALAATAAAATLIAARRATSVDPALALRAE